MYFSTIRTTGNKEYIQIFNFFWIFQLSEVFKYAVVAENTATSPQKCTKVFQYMTINFSMYFCHY